MKFAFRALFTVLCAIGASNAVYAQCANPAGVEGEKIYNENYRVMQYCDDTNWISMGKGASIIHGQKTEGETYNINAVDFDGTVDDVEITTDLTGITNSKSMTFSYWIKTDAAYASAGIIFRKSGGGGIVRFGHNTAGRIFMEGENSSGTDIIAINNASTDAYDGAWHHVLCSFDLSNAANRHCYLDDTDVSGVGWTTYTDDVLDFDGATLIEIAGNGGGRTDAEIADLWIDFGRYIDLSIPANRRKFTNADGQAIDLGANGELPTGTAPEIFLSGDTATWHTNDGTGGGFTELGALTDAPNTPPAATAKKLVGWWRLDETSGTTAADSSDEGNDATYNNLTLPANSATGPVNNAINFDTVAGTGHALAPSTSTYTNLREMTFSAWVNPVQFAGYNGILQLEGVGALWLVWNSNELAFQAGAWDTQVGNWRVANATPANTWTHIAVTYSYDDPIGTLPQFYVNGAPIASTGTAFIPSGTYTPPATAPAYIGGIELSGIRDFEGLVDDARIYNFELSAAQIAELYAASSDFYEPNAVNFDGTNDYLTRGGDLTGHSDSRMVTGSVWLKTNGGANAYIFDNTSNRFRLAMTGVNGQLAFIADNSSGALILRADSASSIDDDTWHHILFSFDLSDTSKRHLYIDGVSDPTTFSTYVDDIIDFTVANHWIGSIENNTGDYWNGDMADLWLDMGTYIDFSIEANRRKFIDAGGNAVNLGSDGSNPTGTAPDIFLSGDTASWHTNDGTGGGFTLNGALTDASANPQGERLPRYCSTPSEPEGTLIYNSDDHVMQYCDGYTYRPLGPQGNGGAGCTDPVGIAGMMFYNTHFSTLMYCEGDEWIGVGRDTVSAALSNGLIGHWRLDETSGTTAIDSSGNGYDGTYTDVTPVAGSETGPINTSVNFDSGSSAQVTVPANAEFGALTDMTISAWVKPETYDFYSGIVGIGGSNHATGVGTLLLTSGTGTPPYRLLFFAPAWSTAYGGWRNNTVEIPGDQWTHVAVTYSYNDPVGTAPVMYVNGAAIAAPALITPAPSGAHTPPATESIDIGNVTFSGNRTMEGAVDDVRIYNRALTAGEVGALYNLGTIPDACAGSPAIGTTCADGSIYAGLSPDGNVPMYTTPADAGTFAWNNGNASGHTSTSQTSTITGAANTTGIIAVDADSGTGGTQPHNAAQYCADLSAHGSTDWYLPSWDEWAVLDTNHVAIGGFDTSGVAPNGRYWTSTENSATLARFRVTGGGGQNFKETVYAIRCVRK